MFQIKGVVASPGIAVGQVVIHQAELPALPQGDIRPDQVDSEINRFIDARDQTLGQLDKLYQDSLKTLGPDKAAVFDGHKMVVDDEDLEDEVAELIRSGRPAAVAADLVIQENIRMVEQLDNEYLRERAADLKDVSARLICNILGVPVPGLKNLPANAVIFSRDLAPSDTAQLDLDRVLGFVTEVGGRTSHSAILARSLEMPAIVGCQGLADAQVKNGDKVILDAINNRVIIDPYLAQVDEAQTAIEQQESRKKELARLKTLPAVTTDGKQYEMAVNIGQPRDVEAGLGFGAEAVGLFRTEFLFMERDSMPSENTQFEAYRSAAEGMQGRAVIIRTLDIGGDKDLPYLDIPHELNPFLGWRAIRYCLDRPDILRTQLRAIVRASAYGKIRIMFPMVASITELRALKSHLQHVQNELSCADVAFDPDMEVGVMIETPASVMIADLLAQEVDFFSIGTNDLTQYLLAVDRGNENIADLYDSFSPSVLRAVKTVVDAGHRAGIWVGMCGEFAGDDKAARILAGLGLDEFSMSAPSIPGIKQILRQSSYEDLVKLADECLGCYTSDEVKRLLETRPE